MEEGILIFWQQLGLSAVTSAVVSILFAALYRIMFNRIAEGQKAEFQKQLENLKARNEKFNYISKAQFDTEFKIHQELAEAGFKLVKSLPCIEKKHEFAEILNKGENIETIKNYLLDYEKLIHKNAAFMPENIYSKYFEYFSFIKEQINQYELDYMEGKELDGYIVHINAIQRNKFNNNLNKELRKYLESLSVRDN